MTKEERKMYNKRWYEKNRVKALANSIAYYKEHKLQQLAYAKQYTIDNVAKVTKRQQEYYQRNKSAFTKSALKRVHNDVQFKLRKALRHCVYIAIISKPGFENTKTETLIGCSISEFKKHIEQLFSEGMQWDTYGRLKNGSYGWEIDHIKPCASFDLTSATAKLECFHYTNMRPLWRKDNVARSNKTRSM